MTQAFNLSQLANKVNTSGQLDGATGLTGTITSSGLSITGNSNLATSSGSVGIGTTSPAAKLDVRYTSFTPASSIGSLLVEESTAWSQSIQFYINSAGLYATSRPSGALGSANSNNMFLTGGSIITNDVDASNGLTAYASSASMYRCGAGSHVWYGNTSLTAGSTFTQTERMRIDSGGNLRIGTTSAIGSSNERLGILQTNTSSDIITVRNSGATAGRYWSAPYVDTSSTYFIINNDSTGVKLTHGSTSWSAQSDARLKNITGTYTNALSDIAQIQPVKFTWKDDLTNKAQVGVIAQSVLPVVPEAVEALIIPKSEDETEYLSVRYTELIPLIIASIQEQQTIINDLKARIETLELK
jgi:hypothetical protein